MLSSQGQGSLYNQPFGLGLTNKTHRQPAADPIVTVTF
jgi:hypothetical protein